MTQATSNSSQYERHMAAMKKTAPRGSIIYSVAMRGREGQIVGARYFVAHAANQISEITPYVATVTGSKWDNVTGIMKTRAISDAVDLLGIRVFDDGHAYYHSSLV